MKKETILRPKCPECGNETWFIKCSKCGHNDINNLLRPTIITDKDPCVYHNMPCAVMETQLAVLELETKIFLPSQKAQKEGWMLIKAPKWLRGFLKRYEPPFVNRKLK